MTKKKYMFEVEDGCGCVFCDMGLKPDLLIHVSEKPERRQIVHYDAKHVRFVECTKPRPELD